ncbi:MAG TPA: GH1 family beta-glucosidase [Candidatus Limnocylindrales bacterium]|nr:GH1 family beta-glucosidase [Candidatus Limnocylindrales bacterium]
MFGKDFLWGTATAAYQIEGAVSEDGRGPSIWDTFVAQPGRVKDGHTGDVACDHYHRYPEDIELMRELGIGAYRFSIAWPRVRPLGSGAPNPKGLDFYDQLVDRLLAAGIKPAVTLFHWDLPQALEDEGGWLSRETAYRFADYAAMVGQRLGDRVHLWMPLNEPVVVSMFGYATGHHAPGRTLGFGALPVVHHLLLGHGLATQALRASGCGNIGIASNHAPAWPASDSEEDREAAAGYDTLVNRMYADPILLGRYPDPLITALMPDGWEDDMATIAAPLDWFGLNYYQPVLVAAPGAATAGSAAIEGAALPEGLPFVPVQLTGYPTTDFGWPVVPGGLREILVTFKQRYGDRLPPIYITESGCSYHDTVDADGAVHDPARVAYHEAHLRALSEAVEAGVDVRGYFVWSLLDNFEWAAGYRERFGLVHVDYDTLKRTPKDSFYWYQGMIATGGGPQASNFS